MSWASVKLVVRSSLLTRSLLLGRHIRCRAFSDDNRVLPNTIFVGQIPLQTTEEELKSYFPGCVSARIVTNRDISAGFSRGFGYVHFITEEEAAEALKKKVEIQGRSLYLDMAVSNDDVIGEVPSTPSTKLFVGRLPLNLTADELKSYFPGCTSAKVVTDKFTKASKGYAFVDYGTPDKAREGLRMNGAEIRGKRIIVDTPRFTRENHAAKGAAKGTTKGSVSSDIIKRGNNPPSSTLFVKNLSFFTNVTSMKEAFKGCVKATIMKKPDTGQSQGYGFVEYSSMEEAKAVFDKQENIELDGRTLHIDYSSPNRKESVITPSPPYGESATKSVA